MADTERSPQPTAETIMALLVARIRAVIGPQPEPGDWAAARFDEDLHADSLDLVEIIEGVERELAEGGLRVSLSDEELLALRTVGDAAARLSSTTGRG